MTKRPNNSADLTLVIKNKRGQIKKWGLGVLLEDKPMPRIIGMMRSFYRNIDKTKKPEFTNTMNSIMEFIRENNES